MPSTTLRLIEWLGRAEGGSAALGGKAASLDRLIRLGFRVPPGFCVTTAGATHDGRDLDEQIAAAVSQLAGAADVAAPTFAVRSSAVGEDSSTASYAGLHDTELGVAAADVPAAIRRCWASLWSEAALAYRARRGLSLDDAEMAVVVQLLVPAEAAAVVFTRHPVTGRDDQLVMTAVRGLGDDMVSGTVTPDTIVLDRATLGILEHDVADEAAGAAISGEQIRALAAHAIDVERHYGAAIDVEAALGDGHWYLLQARPITTGPGQ